MTCPRSLRPLMAATAAGLALLAGVLPACGSDASAPDGPRSVVLISMDTTRADLIGAYGSPLRASPAVDALAERGVVFENAYAPMPQTLPAHASLFTGLSPRDHGALENTFQLADDKVTLAERARDQGYATGAFIGALAIEELTGIGQGFDVFDQPAGDWGADRRGHPPERPAREVTDQALAWADGLSADRPYLLFAHYYDPHGPFEPAPADVAAIPVGAVRQELQARADVLRVPRGATMDDMVAFWRAYAGEIRGTDRQIQRLLDGLEGRGLLDDALIVLVGDHGEGLYEHGQKAHGTHIWEEMMRVPFVIVDPRAPDPGRRVSEPVVLADVMPTIEALAFGDDPGDRDSRVGRSLADVVRGEGRLPKRAVYVERPHFDEERIKWRGGGRLEHGVHVAVIKEGFKLERKPNGTERLFHLESDPDELVDASARYPRELALMRGELSRWLEAHSLDGELGDSGELSEERAEILRALGYIGPADTGGDSSAEDDEGN